MRRCFRRRSRETPKFQPWIRGNSRTTARVNGRVLVSKQSPDRLQACFASLASVGPVPRGQEETTMKSGFNFAMLAAVLALVAGASPPAAPQTSGKTPSKALAIKANDPALQWGPCPPILAGDCHIAVL